MTSGLVFLFLFFLPTNMKIGKWSEKSAYKIPDLRMGLCLLDVYRLSIKVLTVLFVLPPVVAMRVGKVMVGPNHYSKMYREDLVYFYDY